ncbi:MAG TPA: class I SAM-dependent methyltransferase [Candidatus Limnocylindria bacterium]|nr:class I SAM-dependent methyltransferase [Candidatus Limnocylindria bacterium]
MILDLGTGDGRAVVRRARREPYALVIGADADAAAMREASLRAARQQRKGGLPNALFLATSAERLPGPLAGKVDLLTVVLPWGSLLRGVALPDPDLLARLSCALRPAGELELLLSVQPADRSLGLDVLDGPTIDELMLAYVAAGLGCREARRATGDDVDRLGSSWARRLGVPHLRPAWLLRFGRLEEPPPGEGASVWAEARREPSPAAPLALDGEATHDPAPLSDRPLADGYPAARYDDRGLLPGGGPGSRHAASGRRGHDARPAAARRRRRRQ